MTKGLNMFKMRYIFGNWLKCSETAKIFGKLRRSVGNGSDMWGNVLIIWQTA